MREREPLNWSMPLPGKILGVSVGIHVLFPCVALAVILRAASAPDNAPGAWIQACAVMAMLFACVCLHEFGHVFAARRAGGDALEVLLWPLGGLAPADLPHSARAQFWTAVSGPAVNLALAAVAGVALVALGFIPPLNPLASPLNPHMRNWRDGLTYFSYAKRNEAEYWYFTDADQKLQQVKLTFDRGEDGQETLRPTTPPVEQVTQNGSTLIVVKDSRTQLKPARLGRWKLLLAQFFAVNALLFWLNLLPAFPLDGGKMFQCWRWQRGDWRQATATAAYVGFLVMIPVGIYAIVASDLLIAGLAVVIYLQSRQQLLQLERTEEEPSSLGYDFSQGYTSLERQEKEEPPPPPPKAGWLRRWLDRRAQQRLVREQQRREYEEHRLDELLDKIHRSGKQSLSDDELRFLTRMSSRYPNRKES